MIVTKLHPSQIDTSNSPTDGEVLTYNASTGRLFWHTVTISGDFSFVNLTDTPSSYIANKWLQVNPTGNALIFTDAPTISGLSTFTNLTDTPSTYVGESRKAVAVNVGETALEFIDTLTEAEVTDLTDGGGSTLHYHSTDRDRTNHTGTQTASTISDFDAEVSNNTDVLANTSARHNAVTVSGVGGINLTIAGQDISATLNISPLTDIGTPANDDIIVIEDVTDGSIKKVLWSEVLVSGGAGAGNFLELTDTPVTYSGYEGYLTRVNTLGTGLEFVDSSIFSGGGGASNFIGLTDTPSDYTGQAGGFVVVNQGETGLEFTAIVESEQTLRYAFLLGVG